jgi:hypothetical protein
MSDRAGVLRGLGPFVFMSAFSTSLVRSGEAPRPGEAVWWLSPPGGWSDIDGAPPRLFCFLRPPPEGLESYGASVLLLL